MGAFILTNLLPSLRHALLWRPHVIHAHFAVPTGVLAWGVHIISGLPYVLTVQLGDVPGALPEQTDHLFRVVKPFSRPIWKRAACVVAVSDHIRDLAVRSYGVPVRTIPNAIDLARCIPSPTRPFTPRRIVFAGRFNAQKNLLFLMDVLSGLSDQDWQLDMLGDGPLMGAVRRRIGEGNLRGRITLHGWVDPSVVQENMRRSDILLLPSTAEGLPLVGAMALGHGLAIVGSDVGGIRDVVKEGQNGFLCPVGDRTAFQQALRSLLASDDLLEEMKRSSLELARTFDLETVGTLYENVLKEVCTGVL
jgi:glycosyltransferase involved in cell wall biosynthesis